MKDDVLDLIKEKLLGELIDKMSDGDDRMKPPKAVGVEVQAPDKAKLAEGLDKAKDLLASAPDKGPGDEAPSDDDDEERMLQLLSQHDDDDDEEGEKY